MAGPLLPGSSLAGAADNDVLAAGGAGDNGTLAGGAGDDTFAGVSGGSHGSLLVGGPGRDRFVLSPQVLTAVFSTGTAPSADRIADFAPGSAGDQLDLAGVLGGPGNWSAVSPNPFVAGRLRLLQDGADTVLQLNAAAGPAGNGWVSILTLADCPASALTAANIVQGFNPWGAAGLALATGASAGLLSGGPDNDTLVGGPGADTLQGLAGADSLDGGAGRDWLSGGAGRDTLRGGEGGDTLVGGAGDDLLLGEEGCDSLDGGDGNDSLDGGPGADTLRGGAGNNLLAGGDGDDLLIAGGGAETLDGGAGNDTLEGVSTGGGSVFTGGAGADVFRLSPAVAATLGFTPGPIVADRIADFAAGAGGDVFDFGPDLLAVAPGWVNGTNPFASGILQAVQSGADTLLRFHTAGSAGWVTLVVLQGVVAAQLVPANFAVSARPGVTPWQTAGGATAPIAGETLAGGPGPATLAGGQLADSLAGGEGADVLLGGGGNDTLAGGPGADTLRGGPGNDSLDGGPGADWLAGDDGDDTLSGGGGAGTLLGGAGDDLLLVGAGGVLADGGPGDDTFAGVGGGGSTLAGGAGEDVYRFGAEVDADSHPLRIDTITDFARGAGGDRLDLEGVLVAARARFGLAPGANPFAAGYLRIVGSGADTVLQLDRDGPNGPGGWRSVLWFSNVAARGFTAANIAEGWNPFGTAGATLAGSDRDDALTGGPDNDSLTGLYGNDTLRGLGGGDTLAGGPGDDSLAGGDGADSLDGGTGADSLDGGAGDDTLDGGPGDDSLTGGPGDDLIRGGEGDDTIQLSSGVLSSGADTVDAGPGNDTIAGIGGAGRRAVITGGPGADMFVLASAPGFATLPSDVIPAIITDFATGAGGDQINGFDLMAWSQSFGGWSTGQNPFAAGYLRLAQSGTDTLLQLDRDGPSGSGGWATVLRLEGIAAGAVTSANFLAWRDAGGRQTVWAPTAPADLTLRGTVGDDSLTGTAGDDALDGGPGRDTLDGGAGDDTLLGGDGDDVLRDTEGANSLAGGAGADTFDAVSGGDAGNLLAGGAGADRFVLSNAPGFDPAATHPDTITDFAPGPGGDVLDIGLLLLWSQLNGGLVGAINPFAAGYLRLMQDGPDTLLQLDRDGGGDGYITVLRLAGIDVAAPAIDNFFPAWAPGNNPAVQNGSDGGDTLAGVVGNSFLGGGAGDDSLTAGPGNATLSGGDGRDTLRGGDGADVLDGGAGDDRIIISNNRFAQITGGPGTDTLVLAAAGLTLDLAGLVPGRMAGIEVIDLAAGNLLRLDAASAAALPDSGALRITGEAGSRVSFSDAEWSAGSSAAGFTRYQNGGVTVEIADTLAVETTWRITALDADKPEGDGGATPFTFTVTRGGDTRGEGSVGWSVVGAAGGPSASPADFAGGRAPSGLVSFAPGETSQVITIAIAGDTLVEPDEGFRVVLAAPTGGAIAVGGADGMIRNDDVGFTIAATDADKPEGNAGTTPFVFIVTRSGALGAADSVGWRVSGIEGGADAADLGVGAPRSGRLAFAPGETSQTITIAVAGDTAVEPDERFLVQLLDPSAGSTGGPAFGTIRNDDGGFTITADTPALREGNTGVTPFSFTITRQGVIAGPASVGWAVVGGPGESASPADFAGGAAPSGRVSFGPAEVSRTITVNVAGDTAPEPDESFRVVLTGPSAGQALVGGAALATILNDDTGYSITADTPELPEGNSGATPFVFTVSRSGDTSAAGSVGWSASGFGAHPAGLADLVGDIAPAGIASFAAGETSRTITIAVAGDTVVEPDEQFVVRLSAPSGGGRIVSGAAVATIRNDDTGYRIEAANAVRQEGNGGTTPFTFSVTRTGDLSRGGAIGWDVIGGGFNSAAPSDFAGGVAPSGTLAFAAGEAVKLITIMVNGDAEVEPDENFLVQLRPPADGVVLTARAAGLILNDDGIASPPAGLVASSLLPVASADFDGDGVADLLRQAAGGALYLLDGRSGAIMALAGSEGMRFIAATRLDPDPCADLVLVDPAGGLHAWLMQGASVLHDDLLAQPSPGARVGVIADAAGGAGIVLHDPAAAQPYTVFAIGSANVVTMTGSSMPPAGWRPSTAG